MAIGKPKNYEELKGDWQPLAQGGHKCVIKEVRETVSEYDSSKTVVLISFDTAEEDQQPMYFTNLYLSDKRQDKKWRGTKSYFVESEYFEKQLSKFVGALEASNPDVHFWKKDELDVKACKNQRIGIVFRGKEYQKQDGSIGFTVEPFFFCDYDQAFDQDVPEVKKVERPAQAQAPASAPADEGFMDIADGLDDEGLPFS